VCTRRIIANSNFHYNIYIQFFSWQVFTARQVFRGWRNLSTTGQRFNFSGACVFLQQGRLKLYIRNKIGIIMEIMWTSQKSVRISVLLINHEMLIYAVLKIRDFRKLLRLLLTTPQTLLRGPLCGRDPPFGTTALDNLRKIETFFLK